MRILSINLLLVCLGIINSTTAAQTVDVEVIYAKPQARELQLTLSGNVKALNDAQLATQESGVVKAVYVDAGDTVKTGQVLLALDDSLAKIELTQAKAQLASANIKYQEDLRLYNEIVVLAKKEVIAKTLLAERKSNAANSHALFNQAKSNVERQQTVLKRHQLIAPFDGSIANRNIDLGEWVTPQNKVLQLVSTTQLRIFVDIPQEYFHTITQASEVPVTVAANFNASNSMALKLSQFNRVSDPVSRTFQGRIDLPPNTNFVSGMSANVSLQLPGNNRSQVNLPKSSLKRHPDGSYSIYAVVNNTVKRIGVRLLSTGFESVLVQGVPENTAVITSGTDLLIENMSVNIVPGKEV